MSMLAILFKVFIALLLVLGICAVVGVFVFLGSFDIRDGLAAMADMTERKE